MTIVTVSTDSEPALAEPVFIIKVDDAYYLTKAVWEYRMADATRSEQEQGVSEIANLFATTEPKLDAILVRPLAAAIIHEATTPPDPSDG